VNPKSKGQAILFVVLILGVIMAGVVFFGAKRQDDVDTLIQRLDGTQTANEILTSAAKRVQQIYSNESGCDPDVLDTRLSRLARLPTAPADLGFGASFQYAAAVPGSLSAAVRQNRCDASATGCRQLAFPLENLIHVVTVGAVVTGAKAGTGDCPRDAIVRLSTSIKGQVYSQRVSLINICSFDSCNSSDDFSFLTNTGANTFRNAGTSNAGSAWDHNDWVAACGALPATWYGSIVWNSANENWKAGIDDLRWLRRYLETGAGAVGETTYMTFASTPSGNGACSSNTALCVGQACVPGVDFNRDRRVNEDDLAIFEKALRGFVPALPASAILPGQ
jgi:hypothetical protein